MATGNQKSRKIGQSISFIVVILVLLAVVGFLAVSTDGFTGELKTFYLKVNGQTVMQNANGVEMGRETPFKVDVVFPLDSSAPETINYSFELVPLAEFDFVVDDEYYSFSSITNLIEGFNVTKTADGFTLTSKGDLAGVIKSLYPGREVVVDKGQVDFSQDLFNIVVYPASKSTSITLGIRFLDGVVSGVTLSPEVIVF